MPFQPNPLSILTSTDTEYINTFFDHPDHLQPFNPFEFDSLATGKHPGDADYSLYGVGANAAQTGSVSHPSANQVEDNGAYHFHNQPQTISGHHAWNEASHQMSAADFSAASTLEHFRSTDSSNANLGMQANSFSAWGSIAMPAGQTNASSGGLLKDLHSAFPANSQHFAGVPMSAPRSGAQMPNTEAWESIHRSQCQSSVHTASRNGSHAHPRRPASASRPDPAGVRFGTDNNFTGNFYNAPNSAVPDHSKAHNLMGVPLAERIAKDGYSQDLPLRNEGTSRPGGNATSSSGAGPIGIPAGDVHPWSASHPSPDGTEGLQTYHKKRRRSNNGGTEGFAPSQATSVMTNYVTSSVDNRGDNDELRSPSGTIKRPRSSVGSGSPPGDSFKKKRSAGKKRETLSEQQKKENHIASEQKRRGVITQQYANLDLLIPSCGRRSGLSRAEKLQETVGYIRALKGADAEMMAALGLDAAAIASAASAHAGNASVNAMRP